MIAQSVKRHGTISVLDPDKLVLTGFTHSYAEEALGLMTEPLGQLPVPRLDLSVMYC